jgi:thioredoxin 1
MPCNLFFLYMLQVLSFFQEGCMACMEQEPITREVADAHALPVESINPMKEKQYIDQYKLRVTPTILILKDGNVVERFEGVVHREQMEEAVRRYL